MKPTSFLFEDTLTPQCHCGNQPGGRRALRGVERQSRRAANRMTYRLVSSCLTINRVINKTSSHQSVRNENLPFEKVGRIIKSEHVVVVLHIVLI